MSLILEQRALPAAHHTVSKPRRFSLIVSLHVGSGVGGGRVAIRGGGSGSGDGCGGDRGGSVRKRKRGRGVSRDLHSDGSRGGGGQHL